eukprot:254022-Pyramimonas_sp.AAC.1
MTRCAMCTGPSGVHKRLRRRRRPTRAALQAPVSTHTHTHTHTRTAHGWHASVTLVVVWDRRRPHVSNMLANNGMWMAPRWHCSYLPGLAPPLNGYIPGSAHPLNRDAVWHCVPSLQSYSWSHLGPRWFCAGGDVRRACMQQGGAHI